MLGLLLTIDTDEPYDRNVRRRAKLPKDDRDGAKRKAWKYALRAVDLHCDTSDIHATATEKVAAGLDMSEPLSQFGTPSNLLKHAPSSDFPWVTVTDRDALEQLQERGAAPANAELDEFTVRVAFAGRQGERGWDGWVLVQRQNGDVEGTANNCHVISLSVTIVEM